MSEIADDGHRCAIRRLALYARCDHVRVRRGQGWFAVATGVSSNDMNGVVTTDPTELDDRDLDGLLDWFRESGLPASWFTVRAHAPLTAALLDRGAHAERTGWWAGGPLSAPSRQHDRRSGLTVRRVHDASDLDAWLDVADQCGWVDDDLDRRARRSLYRAVGLDDDRLAHWLAVDDGRAVGMASSFVDGDVVDLCNLAVLTAERRRGIGTALIDNRLAQAASHGATTAVSALSPDGWEVYRRRGFRSVPVTPDVCFYLPSADAEPRGVLPAVPTDREDLE